MTQPTILVTVTDPAFEVVVFHMPTGGAEVVITSPIAPRKPTRILLDPPPKGRRIATICNPETRTVNVVYKDVGNGQ